ncbi:MAG: cold shock domain-containing protein [Candidatus Peribacteraceae bacterium]|nr:cold shock domain-containing protein [Candidatus Peribacteraceae bacterium]
MEDTKIIGVVKWFSNKQGYGFVIGPNQEDVFVHFSYIEMEGYRTLEKGQEIKYNFVQTDRGPQAHNIEIP